MDLSNMDLQQFLFAVLDALRDKLLPLCVSVTCTMRWAFLLSRSLEPTQHQSDL